MYFIDFLCVIKYLKNISLSQNVEAILPISLVLEEMLRLELVFDGNMGNEETNKVVRLLF